MTAKEMLEEGKRHIANNMTDEEENIAYKLFKDALPYYHKQIEEYPAGLKLRLGLNGFGSAWQAANDIANHYLKTPRLIRKAQLELRKAQIN